MMPKFYDVTLRDGNHALRHSLNPKFVTNYCKKADLTDCYAVEVGHGNGLGASSFLVGKSGFTDEILLTAAREALSKPKLAVHSIPGFSTVKDNLKPAISIGVDLFRVATHVSEASLANKHIDFLLNAGVEVQGVLMMSHMIDTNDLIDQIKILANFGTKTVILMDSAGYFFPSEVESKIKAIKNELDIEIGFHAHNNLGVAVTNAMAAYASGASIIDGAAMGLGAGAGNAQLENIVTNFKKIHSTTEYIQKYLDLSDLVSEEYPDRLPLSKSSSVQSALSGVFSGYSPLVQEVSESTGVSKTQIWTELGKRKIVAGQESMIMEIAQDLMNL